MPRSKRTPAPKPSRKSTMRVVSVETNPADVLLARLMELHGGLSAKNRQALIDMNFKIAMDKKSNATTKLAATDRLQEFDKITLGAGKLMIDGLLASQAAKAHQDGHDQLNPDQVTELVGVLARTDPPEVVEDQESTSDEDGSGVGEPSIFDEVARQMAGRSAG